MNPSNASPRELADLEFAKLGDPNVPARLKRLAGTIALMGLIFAITGVACLLFVWTRNGPAWRAISLVAPPSPLAASLSFFAIGFGVIAFWAVKQMPHRNGVRAMGIAALLVGLAGPPIYTMQAFRIHVQLQQGEVEKVQTLTQAALAANERLGHFPADILELAQATTLPPDAFKTTFGSSAKIDSIPTATHSDPEYAGVLKRFSDQADFIYLAGNIAKPISPGARSRIIIVRSKFPHLESQSAAVGFADGTTRWISLEDAKELYDDDDAARQSMGAASRPATPAIQK